MTLLKQILFCLLCAFALWAGGFLWFFSQIPKSTDTVALLQADAIVTLTGSGGRVERGLQLLAEGKGKALFISGVSKGVTVADITRQASPETAKRLTNEMRRAIALGDNAVNTIGNAEETRRWLEGKPYTRLLLVTSNYHMPRSLSEFAELMPAVTFIPAPVFPAADPDTRKLILSEYHKFLISKLRHWFVSATHG